MAKVRKLYHKGVIELLRIPIISHFLRFRFQ